MKHFFIIGAQRSSTTYLYTLLDQHPEIAMARPVRPEPKYFLQEDCRSLGKDHYLKTYFEPKTTAIAYGEKSTSYIESNFAAENIKQLFPGAQILVLLRNPIDRALSNYFFSLKNGIETRTIEDAFLNDVEVQIDIRKFSANPFAYVERGEYIRYLAMYARIFARSQIKPIVTEKLLHNPIQEISKLYRWIGVNPEFQPENSDEVINSAPRERAVPPKVREKLYLHYNNWNIKLAENYGLDLTYWKHD